MICQNCKMQLPDDSEFCQYCGTKITVPETNAIPIIEHTEPNASASATRSLETEAVYPRETVKENHTVDAAAPPKEAKTWKIATIIMCFVLVATAAFSIFEYMDIKDLNSALNEKNAYIKKQDADIEVLEEKFEKLEDNYDTIINAAKNENLGYGSRNFNTDESIIVVRKNEVNRQVTLTENWSYGGTVTIDYGERNPSARFNFDEDKWYTSTTLTVVAYHEGVTVAKFSNTADERTFAVIIIVK